MHPEQRPTIIDTHAEPAPVGPSQLPANGDAVDQVEATLWVTALQGVGPVVELAAKLPVGAVKDVLLNTLPDEWRNGDAFGLLQRLTDQDAAMLLAWVCRQWWEAYGLGQAHHEVGEDLRAATGDAMTRSAP